MCKFAFPLHNFAPPGRPSTHRYGPLPPPPLRILPSHPTTSAQRACALLRPRFLFFLAHRSEPTSRVRRPQANATISAPRLFTSPEESWLRHRIGPQRWLSSRLPPSSSCLSATVVPARYVEIAFLRASLCLYRPPAELLPRLRRPAQRSSRPRTSRSHANRRPLPV